MTLSALICLLALAPAAPPGFAVVELFTSEGCSSCPPADRLLAKLSQRGGSVYALEFHVDYWNSLGWRDPYSAAAYSDRQRNYAAQLGEVQVYTPQMIVNGTNAFVGSDREHAEAAIAAGLGQRPQVAIQAAIQGDRLTYRAPGAPKGARLCIAIVDAHRTTKVPRGENAGMTLEHARVVRAFTSAALASAEGSLALPGKVPAGGAVVAFVQDGSGAILGAAEAR
jgi:hypothetical protein